MRCEYNCMCATVWRAKLALIVLHCMYCSTLHASNERDSVFGSASDGGGRREIVTCE